MVNVEGDLHMTSGEGEGTYAKYSRRQTIVIHETKPVIEKATIEVYKAILPKTMVIADLGCSAGPNTMFFMSYVINIIADHCSKLDEHDPIELQFFLNNLPGNDFNQLFRSLEKITNSITTDHMGDLPPSYYISGLPKSYYSRLFPRQSVHLFHSSYCLHWCSQGLVNKEKLESFNLPIYGPSVDEVKEIVMKSHMFDLDHMKLFEANWDPYDDSVDDVVHDIASSSQNITTGIRSVLESLIARQVILEKTYLMHCFKSLGPLWPNTLRGRRQKI
uniref:Jasmonate O-methyltransferase n=1 Tax=Oryza punctata TaxID=4537 RepID=A0A0E0L9V7_ORYPU